MSENLTTANESGVVQVAQENQVLVQYGKNEGQMVNESECIIINLCDGTTLIATIHDIHSEDIVIFQNKYWLASECEEVQCGVYAHDNVPSIYIVNLSSGNRATKMDGVYRTIQSGRLFHKDEMEDENIVYLFNGTDGNRAEYEHNCIEVNDENGNTFWAADNDSYNYILSPSNGLYYSSDEACEYDGLVYDSEDGEWLSQEDWNTRHGGDGYSTHYNTRSYHHFSRRSKLDDNHCGFKIGLEVEKEDRNVKVDIDADSLYEATGWCKEVDGSLDEKKGFEAVSPVYSLFGKQLSIDLRNKDIRRILNAEYNTERCGGHINLSSDEYSKEELYEGLSAFLPLLYSIYENRMNQSYCRAKKKNEMIVRADKYSAVYIRDNRIEYRIFPAVRSVENFMWRIELIRIMCKNINATELQVFKMLMNKNSRLHKHLLKIMDIERIHKKAVKYLEYSKAFNDKNIDKEGNGLLKK